MTIMNSDIYDALLSAGAPDDKARKAAESVAAYENRFASMDVKFEQWRSDLAVLKWMVGANIAVTLIVLAQLLRLTHAS